jgi:thiol-disulfide isomerase/thioredoxin
MKVGLPAPDFVLNDLAGKPVRLSDLKGKVVLIEFWTTWCPPCKMAIPELNALQRKYMDREFVILSISTDEDISTVRSYVEENDVRFPVLFDDKNVNVSYRIYTIPTVVVVDENGLVLKHHRGFAPGIFEELLKDVRIP